MAEGSRLSVRELAQLSARARWSALRKALQSMRAGFAQAEEMGRALRATLGPQPAATLWASPTGRALQTIAVIANPMKKRACRFPGLSSWPKRVTDWSFMKGDRPRRGK